jgi:hypothetical protein
MPEEPGWYPDPKGEANFRFHDGRKWTKSVADAPPGAERPDDGPVEGGLLGLLAHQPVNQPAEPGSSASPPLTPWPSDPDAYTPRAAPAWSDPPEADEDQPPDRDAGQPPPPPPA